MSTLKLEINLGMTLINKYTNTETKIAEQIKTECSTISDDFREICDLYNNVIGFNREDNVKMYDDELLKLLCKDAKTELAGRVQKITKVIKEVYIHNRYGVIEFGGYIIDPSCYSAIKIDGIKVAKLAIE